MRGRCVLSLTVVFAFLAAAGADEKADKEKAKMDPEKLVGTWTFVSGVKNGQKLDAEGLKKQSVTITKETLTMKSEMGDFVFKYKLDSKKSPCQVDLEITEGPVGQGSKTTGIIELKGEELKLCYAAMGGETPKEFASKEDSGNNYFVMKKKK